MEFNDAMMEGTTEVAFDSFVSKLGAKTCKKI